jgi:predicted neutral ceramidase superfamily lipid hydrolase
MLDLGDWTALVQETASALRMQFPLTLLYVVGIVAAIWNFRRHKKVALLVAASCLLLLVTQVASTLIQTWLNQKRQALTLDREEYLMFINALQFVRSLLSAAALAMLFIAAFSWRVARTNLSWETE